MAASMPPELGVAFMSMLPVSELRGAIPVGIWSFGVVWWKCYIFAVLGNMLPVPLILLGLKPASKLFSKTRWGARFFAWLYKRAKQKGTTVERYEALGLFVFVAIPLPVTGAWTGSLVASVFGLRFKAALLAIFLGVATAGVIVTALSMLGLWGGIIAGVVIMGVVIWNYLKK